MNPTAIYSKSGKGVQEASGKTSHLSRPDRAVLSAIDGRTTLAEVAQKVGKNFDAAFERLIENLDKQGFIREVSAGTPVAAPAKPAGKAAAKGTGKMDEASDLDFTTILSTPGKPAPPPQAPPRPAAPPPKAAVNIPPPPPPPSAEEKAKAERIAREQQEAFIRAREEAERKAAAERERAKAEAEAKVRAETEAKLRAEAEAKAKAEAEKKLAAEAEAKVKAAREAAIKAAAEAKAKAEAEAKRAREEAEAEARRVREEAERARREAEEAAERARQEAERLRKEAEEKAERARKEAEEKLRREQEELKRRLEEERKAREEAERKAQEEARRLEEERRRLEEERRAREEAERKAQEEAARLEEERRRLEEEKRRREEEKRREEEERAQRRIQEERERLERKRQREEDEARAAKARARAKEAEREPEPEPEPEPVRAAPPPTPPSNAFADSLLADLSSFSTQEENEQREREEAERKAREEAARRAREEEERRAREEAERQEREAKARRKQEEEERRRREEEELREREEREKQRLKEEEERRKREAEERERKAKEEERLAASAVRAPTYSEEAERRSRRERELAARPGRRQRVERRGWAKPIATTLFVLVVAGLGAAHIVPLDTAPYERGAAEALGRPVKIGSANLSLFTGVMVKLKDVAVGDGIRFPEVRAYPTIGSLLGGGKAFSRIEFEGVKVPQDAAARALVAPVKAEGFSVERVVATKLELEGPLALPKNLEAEIYYNADGTVRAATIRGPEALLARLLPKGGRIEVDLSAASFTLPFAPDISLSEFGLKGAADAKGMAVSEWSGQVLNGTLTGTANVRWGESWAVDGIVTARAINAAVFAPALLSDGRGEGTGKFSMRGGDPGKLGESGRLDGSFTVTRGVLGSIDLSRAIQTGGKQATGRTEFSEMTGQVTYDRGSVALRNVTISAGKLNAGASAEITPKGALSGRIVADVTVSSQTLRAVLNLGGTVKEPQVRN